MEFYCEPDLTCATCRRFQYALPVRVAATISLLCITLEVISDCLLSALLSNFTLLEAFNRHALNAVYAYYYFTFMFGVVLVVMVVDYVLVMKHNKENVWLTPLAKSLSIVVGEFPLCVLLLVIHLNEQIKSAASPSFLSSMMKLIGLIWSLVEFGKMGCCWFCIPCHLGGNQEAQEDGVGFGGFRGDHYALNRGPCYFVVPEWGDNVFHDRRAYLSANGRDNDKIPWEANVRRCFRPSKRRLGMFLINVCHIAAIVVALVNFMFSIYDSY